MKNCIKYLLIVLLLAPHLLLSKDSGLENNFAIFERLTEQIVHETCMIFNRNLYNKIIIRNVDNIDNSWFIEGQFINFFKNAGFDSLILQQQGRELIKDNQTFADSTLLLDFKIIQLGVTYSNKNSFWRTINTERKIAVELWIKSQNLSNGFVHFTNIINKVHTDTIKQNKIIKIQNKNMPFTMAPLPPEPKLRKIFDPLLITGISGGIIYLFYSFRSK